MISVCATCFHACDIAHHFLGALCSTYSRDIGASSILLPLARLLTAIEACPRIDDVRPAGVTERVRILDLTI